MKLLAIVYLLGVVATNNASDLFNTKGSSIAETIEYNGRALDDSSEWDLGTKVYKEFDDGWYEGKITGYDGESYTILWSDGVRSTHDEKAVEQMVTVSPQGSKWDLGTKVYKEFDDEGWYEGTITWYDGESYTITWSDGYRYTYGEHEVEQMIADAETGASFIPSPSGFYPVGTFVSKEFGDDWYFGQIEGYSGDLYIVLWSNDHTELYGHDEIAQMVLDAETSMPGDSETNNASSDTEAFAVGTRVYKEFEDDTYYYGQVENFDGSLYTVVWANGDTETYGHDEVAQMLVDSGASTPVESETNNTITDSSPFAIGTDVYQQSTGDLYYGLYGQVEAYDDSTGTYTVVWSNGQTSTYGHDDVAQMVSDTASTSVDGDSTEDDPEMLYPIGTTVYKERLDRWYWGTITVYLDGVYTVRWEDGKVDNFDSPDEIEEMVQNAVNEIEKRDNQANGQINAKESSGIGGGFTAVIVVAAVFAGTVLLRRSYSERQRRKFATEMIDDVDRYLDEDLEINPPPIS